MSTPFAALPVWHELKAYLVCVCAKLLERFDAVAAAQLLARGCQEVRVLLHHLDA